MDPDLCFDTLRISAFYINASSQASEHVDHDFKTLH